jgi:hypothetical protein
MAFTPAEKLSISRIVGMTPTLLDAHLLSLGAALTADVETAVRAELARWTTTGAGSVFTKFTPTESNRGLNLNSDGEKSDIRGNIRLLLEIFPTGAGSLGIGTIQVGT